MHIAVVVVIILSVFELTVILNTSTYLLCSLLGVDKLFSYAINEWLNDIKKNQLPGLLGGVGPIHSLVQLGECISLSQCPLL